ncbi:MAG: WecB/TagA/CpsF family glycosyltransferase [Caulobacteraceae bacterium]|nr:WecB/TagA/CpsF family glycosyltransferase [Caulobacteraceae bacterium]
MPPASAPSLTAAAPPSAFREVRFAGLRFTPLNIEETTAALLGRDPAAPFAAFITPNVEHAALRRGNPEFSLCGDTCWISTNDSQVMRRAARLAGLDLKLAAGAHVVDRMARAGMDRGEPLTIIGGAEEMAEALRDQFGFSRVQQHIPPMGMIRNDEAVRAAIDYIVAHPARFVFVAMGPPQSEQFCQRVIADGRATGVGLCIGSSLAVLTGRSTPAPDWMEKRGLVWAYRLLTEPRRLWRRYLVRDMIGLGLCIRDILALRLGLKSAA